MKSRKFYRHKMEVPLVVVSFAVSVIVFVLLSYLGFEATIGSEENNLILQILQIESGFAEMVMKIGGYISIVILLFIFINTMFLHEDSNIKAVAHDVHVTKKQLSVLIKAEKEYAKKLGIKNLPQLFVSKDLNVLELYGASIDNPNAIRIPCGEIIATADKKYYSAKFTIAKHLACIYMGYYNPIRFIIFSFSIFVPILSHVNNRVMTYSTDKIAAELVGKNEAIHSILEQEVDIWFLPYMDVKEYIENTKNIVKNKNMIWENIFSNTPITAYRIDALRNGKDGKLF